MVLKMLGVSSFEASMFVAELKKKHEEPHRFYHTWEHIVELFGHLFERGANDDLGDEEFAML